MHHLRLYAGEWSGTLLSRNRGQRNLESCFFITLLNLNYSDFFKKRTNSAFFCPPSPIISHLPIPLSGVSVGERRLPRGRTVAVTMGMGSAEHLNYWVGQLISIKAWLIFHQRLEAGTSTWVHRRWKGAVGDKREREEDKDNSAETRATAKDDKMRCKRHLKGRRSEEDESEVLKLQQGVNYEARLCPKSLA